MSFQTFAESMNVALNLPTDKGIYVHIQKGIYKVYLHVELSPYIVGEVFYNGEIENELRRINRIDFRLKKDSDREKCMEMIEKIRQQDIYPHLTCTMECQQRGTY